MSGESGDMERAEFVELIRRCSSSAEVARAPVLGSELAALAGRALPRRPRTVFFDVYGTLLSSAAGEELEAPGDSGSVEEEGEGGTAFLLLSEALQGLRAGIGAREFLRGVTRGIEVSYARRAKGMDYPEVDIVLVVERVLPSLPRPAVRRLALLRELVVNPCSPMPGARAALDGIRSSGLAMGLISNAQFYTRYVVEAALGASPRELGFDPRLSFYSYRLGSGKPGRLLYERAAAALSSLGFRAKEAVHVGNDCRKDVEPAANLGFMTLLFAGDERSLRCAAPGAGSRGPDSVARDMGMAAEICLGP